MEELADDVRSGGDAEDDGAEDLLPPGQQQHGVLFPATLAIRYISLYQAYGTVTFLPVTLVEGEVVTIVYREEKGEISLWGFVNFVPLLYIGNRQVLTIWILKDGQGAVTVFIVGEFVIIQTLVKFIRADQGWCPRRRICVKDRDEKVL